MGYCTNTVMIAVHPFRNIILYYSDKKNRVKVMVSSYICTVLDFEYMYIALVHRICHISLVLI
jgi:hypothetical protein